MELIDVVIKLNGYITPVGDASIDHKRFENLKNLCALVNTLVGYIDDVAFTKGDHMASIKQAKDYADNFLTKTLGIPKD